MGSEREFKNYRQPWITGFLDEWYRPGPQFAALTLAELAWFFERSDYLRQFWNLHPAFSHAVGWLWQHAGGLLTMDPTF